MNRNKLGDLGKPEQRRRQEERQARFPDDRIAFGDWPSAVIEDCLALKRWANGEITFDWLRAVVAKNNLLENVFPNGMIPEEMMWNEIRMTGWR